MVSIQNEKLVFHLLKNFRTVKRFSKTAYVCAFKKYKKFTVTSYKCILVFGYNNFQFCSI